MAGFQLTLYGRIWVTPKDDCATKTCSAARVKFSVSADALM
jgi:hypothetical protein